MTVQPIHTGLIPIAEQSLFRRLDQHLPALEEHTVLVITSPQNITMKTSKPRDIEKTYPLPEFIAKLRRLADALEGGKPFTIEVAGERLRIPADAHFNIEHEREGGQEELELQLQWRRSPVRRARSASDG